jgi:endonuclease V-like protein UPF0215 family
MKCNLILLNKQPIIVVFQSRPYAEMIKDDLRTEHFESVFNVEMSEKTHELEVQYEKEYCWEILEIEYVKSDDAIKRAHAAMKASFNEEEEDV